MTSSLVGSEMCIRDSKCAQWDWRVTVSTWSLQQRWEEQWQSWGSAIPVSYTHLTLPTICSV
eukprot:8972898-Prorocentrum_lima.AAC.1